MSLRRVLLVEGRDDREVVYQLCNFFAIDNRKLFDVKTTEGYENLRDRLSVLPKTDVDVIGAVIDADIDLGTRWESVRDVLIEVGYEDIPVLPSEEGTVVRSAGLPVVGVWLMPNNTISGMLEDFIRYLVPEGDGLMAVAAGAVDGIPENERRFAEVHRSKALIHTWLAWQEEPGTPLGLAITRRYLDLKNIHAARFRDWLTTLFVWEGRGK